MAETKPIDGDDLDLLIADRVRQIRARQETNANEAKAITRRDAEIATIGAELAAMRAARTAGTPYPLPA